jgi:hypothetical protein
MRGSIDVSAGMQTKIYERDIGGIASSNRLPLFDLDAGIAGISRCCGRKRYANVIDLHWIELATVLFRIFHAGQPA